MKKILVVGASGFVGRHLVKGLLHAGHAVRCLARSPARVKDLRLAGAEVAEGDICDLPSVLRALESVDAVYLSIHTLSPQPGSGPGQDFMEVETVGIENIVAACRTQGVHRLIYVTFLGIGPESPSAWVRGRWKLEHVLLESGLDVTTIRPAQIVGRGGQGFDTMMSNAGKPVAVMIAPSRQKMRNIAVDDLVYYLVGVLDDRRAYGRCFDVGCDDILTNDQMVDVAAAVLGRKPPLKLHLPPGLLGMLAPWIERRSNLPPGALKGILDSLGTDAVGDPAPIRAILPRQPLSYRQAVERALL